MKSVRFDIHMLVNLSLLIQFPWIHASQWGITPRSLVRRSVLESAYPKWGRWYQHTPTFFTLTGSFRSHPNSFPVYCKDRKQTCSQTLAKPEWQLLHRSWLKAKSTSAPGKDKEKHPPTLAAAMDGFTLLQVITLAQIRSPTGWRTSRFPVISFPGFELEQPQSLLPSSPYPTPFAICTLWSPLRRNKCLGL